MSQSENVKTVESVIHEKYFGCQDKFLKTMVEVKPDSTFLEKRRHTLLNEEGRSTFLFENCGEENIGYTNFRIVSNLNSITKIMFAYGSNTLFSSYPSILKNEYPFDCLKTNVFPAHKYYDCRILAESSGDFEIEYDVCRINDYVDNYTKYLYSFIVHQRHDHDENFSENCNNCKVVLSFNHPTKKMIIKSSDKLSNVKLVLNDTYCITGFVETRDNYYEREFEETINFSKIDYAVIHFDCDNNYVIVNIITESTNVMTFECAPDVCAKYSN